MTLFKNHFNPRKKLLKKGVIFIIGNQWSIDLNHKMYVNSQIIISESILVICCDKYIGL